MKHHVNQILFVTRDEIRPPNDPGAHIAISTRFFIKSFSFGSEEIFGFEDISF